MMHIQRHKINVFQLTCKLSLITWMWLSLFSKSHKTSHSNLMVTSYKKKQHVDLGSTHKDKRGSPWLGTIWNKIFV